MTHRECCVSFPEKKMLDVITTNNRKDKWAANGNAN